MGCWLGVVVDVVVVVDKAVDKLLLVVVGRSVSVWSASSYVDWTAGC